MATLIGICPKCQGNLYDEHDEIKCLQCGFEVNNIISRRKYYNTNFGAIMESYRQKGKKPTLARFKIPPGSLSRLLRIAKKRNGGKPEPVPAAIEAGSLPGLPAFSNDWPAEVQLKWLEVWAERSK